jgi:uncharacterized membrane protein
MDTVVMQASLLSMMILVPTASRSRNLDLCEQYYHKLLEFFFFDFVLSMPVVFSGGWSNH